MNDIKSPLFLVCHFLLLLLLLVTTFCISFFVAVFLLFFFTRKLYIWYLDRPASQQAKQANQNIDNSSRNSNNKKLIRYKRLLHCCDGGGGGGGNSGSCWYCLHFVLSLAATHSNVANFFSGSKSCKRDLSTMLTGFLVTFSSMNHNNNNNNMNCWSSRQAKFFYSCFNCVLFAIEWNARV